MRLFSVASESVFSLVANRPPNYIIKKGRFNLKQVMGALRGRKRNGCTLALISGIFVNAMPRLFYPRRGTENFSLTGIRSPYPPALNESLYQ